jgi:hypothetical protein
MYPTFQHLLTLGMMPVDGVSQYVSMAFNGFENLKHDEKSASTSASHLRSG